MADGEEKKDNLFKKYGLYAAGGAAVTALVGWPVVLGIGLLAITIGYLKEKKSV